MKDKFFGFYPPEEEEIEEIWKSGIIAFDANSLLNLYRYSKSTKDDFINTLNEYSNRIWLPYQSGYEFHSNRIEVIKSQENAYVEICNEFDDVIKQIENKLNRFKRHPFINTGKIISECSKKINKIKNDLEEQSKKHPEYLKSDNILPSITKLFDGRVGENFSEIELQKIYDEGKERYENKTPPGYSDFAQKKNKGSNKLFGDLIIWKHLIHKAKQSKNTIIFVTDDRKDDWWLKIEGKTIRPREELIKEFYNETGFRILIYQADTFLKFANEKLRSHVKETSINEVKQVRVEDELLYHGLDVVNNALSNIDWEKLGTDKLDTANKVFSNIDWEKIGSIANLQIASTGLNDIDWEKIGSIANLQIASTGLNDIDFSPKLNSLNKGKKTSTPKTSEDEDKK